MVELERVTKAYGPTRTPALDGVSLTIERGEFVALTGRAGSGRTTMLTLMAGLDRATSGTVTIAGHLLDIMSEAHLARLRRDRIGLLFGLPNLLPKLTALQNVVLPARLAGVDRRAAEKRGAALLERFGTAAAVSRYPAQLSSGDQQKVALARAMINRPELLLADDPTASLDSASGAELLRLVACLHREGLTIVLAGPGSELSGCQVQRVLGLHDGRLVTDLQLAPAYTAPGEPVSVGANSTGP